MKSSLSLALMFIIVILFSLTAVSAEENVTDSVALGDVEECPDGLCATVLDEDVASGKSVDLSVNVNATPSYVNETYNSVGSEVPWIITVSANGGTALNVNVREVLSNNLQYISHSQSMGSYNPETRMWAIGDLSPSQNATLTIITKLKSAGTYVNKAYVTSDSKETNQLNNFALASMKTGSSKVTSSITETTADREGFDHSVHQASMGGARFVIWEDGRSQGGNGNGGNNNGGGNNNNGGENNNNNGGNNNNNGGSSNNNGGNNNNANGNSKNENDAGNINGDYNSNNGNDAVNGENQHSSAVKAMSLENVLNSTEEVSSIAGNNPLEKFTAVLAYDYLKIPILIFSAFLVLLVAVAGYDKIRNQ